MTVQGQDQHDAMASLERLYAKKVVTLEEAQAAARLLTGDPNAAFPPPPPAAPAKDAAAKNAPDEATTG